MFDPIVEETRKIREEHAARFNFDLDAIYEDCKKSERDLGLPLVTLPPNRIAKPVQGTPGKRPDGRAA
jgi:hypothetical protein